MSVKDIDNEMGKIYEGIFSSIEDSENEIADGAIQASQLERTSKQASIKSEKYLKQINNRVTDIDNGLETERKDREKADSENMTYTKEQDKKNFIVSVLALIGGLVGALTGVIALVLQILGLIV